MCAPFKGAPGLSASEAADEICKRPQDLGPICRWRVTQAPCDQRIDGQPDHDQAEHTDQGDSRKIVSGYRRQPDAEYPFHRCCSFLAASPGG
ncbi:MAG TPA: hypothetical protein VG276_16330 [Actinomycetes bacterium]|nr:hypothetical protein [Actinomycetes bacterium]